MTSILLSLNSTLLALSLLVLKTLPTSNTKLTLISQLLSETESVSCLKPLMESRKVQEILCDNQSSYILSILSKKLRRLCSRIRRLIRSRLRPKVVIRRFGKLSSKNHTKGELGTKKASVSKSGRLGRFNISERPIRIATFNAAMFSLAPAVPNDEDSVELSYESDNSFSFRSPMGTVNDCPIKSILKPSPLHPTKSSTTPEHVSKLRKQPLKVRINLPDNEISLAQSNFFSFNEDKKIGSPSKIASRNHRSSIIMRSPVCLPSNLSSYHYGEGFGGGKSILEVLKEVDADVLALQDVKAVEEKGMKPLSDLAKALGMKYVFAESWAPEYGNAVLSKWPIKRWRVQKIVDDDDFRNVLKATIDVPWAGEVNFYCTQLDHLDENWRTKQINAMIQSNDCPHILAGGLNSLDGSDYSWERWTDIVKYYEEIGKPTPKVEVMKLLKGREYTDSKNFAGECEPVVIIAKGQNVQGTCKYGTRVDYILSSSDSPYKFVPGSYSVISSKGTSDHHIVKADVIKIGNSGIVRRRLKPRFNKAVRLTSSCSSRGVWHVKS